MTPEAAFRAYGAAVSRLPRARHPAAPRPVASLAEATRDVDVVLLDAYGVLNCGTRAIPGAVAAVAALRAAGRHVMVVSNSAGYPKAAMVARLTSMGFDFTADEITTSREALQAHLASEPPCRWAAMIGEDRTEFGEALPLRDDPCTYADAEGFLLIGSDGWTEARQAMLADALRARPRPVLVGNPDIVAPREDGLSLEPGHYAHRLAAEGLAEPVFFGKPFPAIFALAMARIQPATLPSRVLMVGDTLHTDILGGAAMGFATALVTGHGTLPPGGAEAAIAASGIVPDFVMESP